MPERVFTSLSLLLIVAFTPLYVLSSGPVTAATGPGDKANAGFEIIYKDGRQGVANKQGEIVVAPKYREIRINPDNTVSAMPFTKWKIMDGENNLIGEVRYDFVIPLAKGLCKVGIRDHVGLANARGELITEMRPWHIGRFEKGHAVVTENGKSGIINQDGVQLVPVKYDSLFISGGYVVAKINATDKPWAILDFSGNVLTDTNYECISKRSSGFFAVKRNGNWGYITIEGEDIPKQYESAGEFSGRYAIARYMGSEGVINKKGEWVVMPRAEKLERIGKTVFLFRSDGESGLVTLGNKELFRTANQFIRLNHGFLEKDTEGKVGLIDHYGRRLLVTEYDEISPLQQDTVYYFRKDKGWGILTKSGKILLEPDNTVQEIYPMGDEFIGVRINDKYGFIDVNGDLRIANQYDGIGRFSEGLGAVKLLGRWGYVDRIERLIIQPHYEQANEFIDGLAMVKKGGKYGLVDREGELVLSTSFDSLRRNEYGRYVTFRKGEAGLVSREGRQLIYPKYDRLTDLGNGYVIIERNNEFGLVTTNGISTIPLMYDILRYDPYNNIYLAANDPSWEKLTLVKEEQK